MSKNVPIIIGQKIVALDCAMVGGSNNKHILARVSIVDFDGKSILDTFVSPEHTEVCNYRFEQSGIKKQNLIGAPSFSAVQKKVVDIISDKVVIGHNLHFDFTILGLSNPIKFVRDIGRNSFILVTYGHNNEQPSLKKLSKFILERDIQVCSHDSIENAKAIMDIYKYFQTEIENAHLKDIKDNKEINVYFQNELIMQQPESSNVIRNTLVAGGIIVGGIFAVTLGIFNQKKNNK